MPASPSLHEQNLLQTIKNSRAGITLGQLLETNPEISRRTAQRHISHLIKTGIIRAVGNGRARKYNFNGITALAEPDSGGYESSDHSKNSVGAIPLSADALDIARYVDQPLSGRRPVGYQQDFLDAYVPNVSAYLSETLRRQLHRKGRTEQYDSPAGTYSRAILNRLLIDLSWASSNLEGNTYSRLDTIELIRHGTSAEGKDAVETQMILNHKSAIEFLVENVDSVGLDRFTLMNLHSALSENLLQNSEDEGRVRQHAVDISQSVYRPLSIPQKIDTALDDLLSKASAIIDPFEQSFFMMVHLPYLQPFADINKRSSRLAANLPLFRANLCPLTFLGVPEQIYTRAILGVYEMTRVELLRDVFVWAYERSTQEYLTIRQELSEPDQLRLQWRAVIKQVIHDVVVQPDAEPLALIRVAVARVPDSERANVEGLIVEELRRLHEGVLARYGLRPSQLSAWRAAHFPG